MPLTTTLMALSLIAVAALAYWDEERESTAALQDFAEEQTALASALALQLSGQLDQARSEGKLAELLSAPGQGLEPQHLPGPLRVLVLAPGARHFLGSAGSPLEVPRLLEAVGKGDRAIRLLRGEAAALGLPARMAVAGLSSVRTKSGARWTVAVVATAERERDRETRARWRLVLAVTLASGLVLAFGGMALRQQRQELELEQALARAQLAREADSRLAKESRAATMLTLATGVAHEVATPLSVIVGRAEQLLPRVTGDEPAARGVRVILEQAERVHQVILALLRLARGDLSPAAATEPEAIVQRARTLVEHRYRKAEVSLHAAVARGLPPLNGDRLLLEHALTNLLLNACDACAPGGSVEVSARKEDTAFVFEVRDDGVGISALDAERATEAFFTTKPVGQGTGLGLALVNEIVKAHRGVFQLVAHSPRGTRATIRLPLTREGTFP